MHELTGRYVLNLPRPREGRSFKLYWIRWGKLKWMGFLVFLKPVVERRSGRLASASGAGKLGEHTAGTMCKRKERARKPFVRCYTVRNIRVPAPQ